MERNVLYREWFQTCRLQQSGNRLQVGGTHIHSSLYMWIIFLWNKSAICLFSETSISITSIWPRPRAHYIGRDIWKRRFISSVRHSVHSHENEAFRKRSSNRLEKFENAGLVWTENILKIETFRKQRYDNHDIFLSEFSSNTNPEWSAIELKPSFSNSSGAVWTGRKYPHRNCRLCHLMILG